MSGVDRQILELAKQGLTAAEIAESLGYSVEDIGIVLSMNKDIVKSLNKHVEDVKALNDTEAQEKAFASLDELANIVLKEVMEHGDKDSVRLEAAKFVKKQRLGLLKPKVTNNVFVVGDFNDRLQKMEERRKQIEDSGKVIDAAAVAA